MTNKRLGNFNWKMDRTDLNTIQSLLTESDFPVLYEGPESTEGRD